MQREIKFRAWDDLAKKMHISDNLIDSGQILADATVNMGFIVMQFTGLHDRNGKDIYEGDLLKGDHRFANTYKIIFENGCFFAEVVRENPYKVSLYSLLAHSKNGQ